MDELGEYIKQYAALVGRLVWEVFIAGNRGSGDLTDLGGVDHLFFRLLHQYRNQGYLVVLAEMERT